MTSRLFIVLRMIKAEHTVFALPFAFLGALLAARGLPDLRTGALIVLAMIGARSAAMAFNRLADHSFDRYNPRTSDRALVTGEVSRRFVIGFILASAVVFFLAAWLLNPLALVLSPVALLIILGYSFTKRFTVLSHVFLGLALALAPVGGWVAVKGSLTPAPFLIAAAVLFWVAGFDIIYACQDVEFDRRVGLFSAPARLGVGLALWLSALFHALMVLLLLYAFYFFELSWLSWGGLVLLAAGLIYEHSLVKVDDLSRVNAAFFTANGIISIGLLLFVGLDICLSG